MTQTTYSATTRAMSYSGPLIEAVHVADAADFLVEGRTLVVNLDLSPVAVDREPRFSIPPLSSAILTDTRVVAARSLLLLRGALDPEAAPVALTGEPGWALLADLLPAGAFPRQTPLWRGPQDATGDAAFVPETVLRQSPAGPERRYRVLTNLWFAPAGTDCLIHHEHAFLEVHTQVAGRGRMQKFGAPDHGSIYEDVLMSPGYTTPEPFCQVGADGAFSYPWHQYHADTDCVWLAVEYHEQPSSEH
jgi:hypothetical protein